MFQDDLAYFRPISLPLDFIFSGNFNIPFGNSFSDTVAMNNILDMFNLKQHVNFPTHKFGNTLDWLITNDECNLINKNLLHFEKHQQKFITFRETPAKGKST